MTGSCFIYHPVREKATGEARVRVRGSIQKGGVIVREIANTLHTLSAEEKADVIPLEFPLPLSDHDLELHTVEKVFRLQTGFRLRQELPDFW